MFKSWIIFSNFSEFSTTMAISSANLKRFSLRPSMLKPSLPQPIFRNIFANTAEKSLGDIEPSCLRSLFILKVTPKLSSLFIREPLIAVDRLKISLTFHCQKFTTQHLNFALILRHPFLINNISKVPNFFKIIKLL